MAQFIIKIRRMLADRSGNALIEFALLLPAFVTMLLVLVEVANYLWIRNTVDHAARETARYAVVRGPWGGSWPGSATALQDDMTTHAVSEMTGSNLKAAKTTATAKVDTSNRTVEVTVKYAYEPMIVPNSWIGTGTISSTATMDIQRP